jgi:hypothetical protein
VENKDFKEMLSALRDAEVEFIVVGAHALAAHGFVRATGDLDIWVRASPTNAPRVAAAFEEFGGSSIDVFGVTEAELSQPGVGVAIGAEPNRIDLHTDIAGLEFAEALEGALSTEMLGVPILVLGHAALVKAKRASIEKRPDGSPKAAQDAADLAWLESRGPRKKP